MQATNTDQKKDKETIPYKWKDVPSVFSTAGGNHVSRSEIMEDIREYLTPWFDSAKGKDSIKPLMIAANSAPDRVFAKSFDVIYMIGNELQTGVKFGDGIYLEDMDTSKPMEIPEGMEDPETVTCFIFLELLSTREEKLYMTKVSEVAKRKAQAASCAAWPFPTAKSIGTDKA